MEIERKFLTQSPPENIEQYPCTQITQCYIAKSPTIRIRKTDNHHYLTVKGKGHMMREELELPISEEEYQKLLEKADPPQISKTRYLVPLTDKLTAEVDVFLPPFDGLILTEVEFSSEAEAKQFIPPDWFGKDVTYDPQYKNVNLTPKNNGK